METCSSFDPCQHTPMGFYLVPALFIDRAQYRLECLGQYLDLDPTTLQNWGSQHHIDPDTVRSLQQKGISIMSEVFKSGLFSLFTISLGLFTAVLIVIGFTISNAAFVNLLMWFLSYTSIGFVALVLYLSSTKEKKSSD